MNDRAAAVARARVQRFEAGFDTVRALIEIVGCIAQMENAFAARLQPFHRIPLPYARLDHLEIEIAPARKGIAVGDAPRPSAVASAVVCVDALEWAEPQ